MWMWILIGLNIISKANGYASGNFPESCESMAPVHSRRHGPAWTPQTIECPFEVNYTHGAEGEPITVFLKSKTGTTFQGFMLQARKKDKVDEGQPVGKFVLLEHNTQFMRCSGRAHSTVTQKNNQDKHFTKVNWTAEGTELDITFRATFVQTFNIFWVRVDVNVTLPLYTTSTTKPSTTTSTTKPSTTTSTTKPSTTTSTTKPSTTTSTTKPSTTTSTTKPSTTTSTTNPSTTKPPPPNQTYMHAATLLTAFHSVLTMARPHIPIFTLCNSPSSQHLNKVLNTSCSVLCAVLEISALVLFCVGDSCKVILIALVCVVIMIDLIELGTACLPIRPSHELGAIVDLTVNVHSVISEIFTVAVIFIGVLEIEDSRKSRRESWLLIVMFTYTLWIFAFVIWVFLLSTHLRGIEGWRKQRQELSVAEVIIIHVPVILIVGAMLFAVAIAAGIFSCQEK